MGSQPYEPCVVCGVRAAQVEVAVRVLHHTEDEKARCYCRRCWDLLRVSLKRAEDAASSGMWE